MPIASPASLAIGPVSTSASSSSVSISTIASVTATCSGRSFQNGRPSPVSKIVFEARKTPPTQPDALQSAPAMPRTSSTPACAWLLARLSIGPSKVSTADAGPSSETRSVSLSVSSLGSITRPAIETSAISAGKIDSTA